MNLRTIFFAWLDNSIKEKEYSETQTELKDSIDWIRVVPFIILHVSALTVFVVGFSWPAFFAFILMFSLRAFTLTAFYHRYFSHKTFKTSRVVQFIFAFIGATAVQRGPLWWASHHRKHHVVSDTKDDCHSPISNSLFWSHCGWFLSKKNFSTDYNLIKDFCKFPEIKFIDRFDIIAPLLLAIVLYVIGESFFNAGWQFLVWGFVLSTLFLYHVTFSVNSISHLWGTRRYVTKDFSRNNLLVAILAFGEGWHNNHHYYPASTRQGFYWWEIDMSFYILTFLSWFGIVWDIQTIPKKLRESNKRS
ncbi:MAG: acyl-CoA desaturase [Methylacidiphilales bacterium]|nr:acyl-CoA desaturase [Candidatus Methylacidiphilales bacterium]